MQSYFSFVAAAAALLQTSVDLTPAAAQTPRSAVAAQSVTVGFNPPLDRPIRYRRTSTLSSPTRAPAFWMDAEYLFQRREGGFRVQVSIVNIDVDTDNSRHRSRVREAISQLQVPHVLLLDGSGAVVGMENEEAFWNEAMPRLREYVRRSQTDEAPVSEEVTETLLTMLARMPREQKLVFMSMGIRPVIEFASSALRLGERSEVRRYTAGSFFEPVLESVEIVADRIEGDHLFVTTRALVTREAMADAVDAFHERFLPLFGIQYTEAERARAHAESPEANMSRLTEGRAEIDISTGMTRRQQSVERIESGAAPTQITTVVVETID